MEIGKKTSVLEAGYVYAPYAPIQNVSVIIDSNWKRNNRKRSIENIFNLPIGDNSDQFYPKKTLNSRYATKMLNNNFYGVIKVENPPN